MLIIEASLPVAVSLPGQAPTGSVVPGNLQLLRALNLLALGSHEHIDRSAPERANDMARIEAKLDMLLSLVGSLVTNNYPLPPAYPVQFSVELITVQFDQRFGLGDDVVVELYLSAEIPRPLILAARVSRAASASDRSSIAFETAPMDVAVRDEFERYIFLRHRRELAARAPMPS